MEKVKEHIHTQINNSTKKEYPFPHLIIDNFLPDDIFCQLEKEVLKQDNWNRFTIHDGRFGINSSEWNDILKPFYEEIYSCENKELLKNKFRVELEKKKEYYSKSHWNVTLSIDLENYEIPPHMDGSSKQISTIFYISGGNVGTSLYKNDSLDYTKSIKVSEVKFKKNRLLVFCASIFDRTWHGVEKSQLKQKRIAIQGFLELDNKPNIEWHSFGLGSIRYKYKKRKDYL